MSILETNRSVFDHYRSQVSSASSKPTCFASDSVAILSDGNKIGIGQLKPGQELFTMDRFSISVTRMIMMLDQDRTSHSKLLRY